MADFAKILSHPEKDKLITKLIQGDTPKDVAQYLKVKYHEKDQTALRLSSSLLQEFIDKYFNQYQFLDKLVADEKAGKTDKLVYESLLNNKSWKDRIAGLADQEIDFKKKVQELVVLISARAEQIFDKIQQNPDNMKPDYALIKWFELLMNTVEKANKMVNDLPDKVIQHDISVTMVEQHSVMFQEAIRETLLELSPEVSALFMDKLTVKLNGMKPNNLPLPKPKSIEIRQNELSQLLPAMEAYEIVEGEIVEDYTFDPMEESGANVS